MAKLERITRLGWSLGDQVLSSLTNAALSVVVARSVDVGAFGAFSLAFATYSFVLGISRAICSQPMVIRYSSVETRRFKNAAQRSAGTAVVLGAVLGAATAVVGVLAGGTTGDCMIAVGVSMPALLTQDAWRYIFFAQRRPAAAALNDAIWGLFQLGLIALALENSVRDVRWLLGAWGLAAFLSAILGAIQSRLVPKPLKAASWWRENRDLSGYLAADYAVNLGAFNIVVASLGFLGKITIAGAIRGAQVLLGPLRTLLYSAHSAGLAEISRRAKSQPSGVIRVGIIVAVALGGSAALVTIGLMLLPNEFGQRLLGDTWPSARSVLPFIGLMLTAIGVGSGAGLSLQAQGLARANLRASTWQVPFTLVLPLAGLPLAGGIGVAAGLALAEGFGALYLWIQLKRNYDAGVVAREQRDENPGNVQSLGL